VPQQPAIENIGVLVQPIDGREKYIGIPGYENEFIKKAASGARSLEEALT
jgi:hypothetical protein